MLKILHIWDTAGVASVLSKYLRKSYDVKSMVVNIKRLDPYGLTAFYGGRYYEATACTTIRFLMKGLTYDIIHVHSAYRFVKYFKRLYPNKRVVMHFHGEDVRLAGWKNLKEILKKANLVLVSTQDMLDGAPSNVFWLPNPIDMEHFKPMPSLRNIGTAVFFVKHQRGEVVDWSKNIAKQFNLKLHLHDRKVNPVPYRQLPSFLNKFEYYIDQNWIPSLSKTALEALACGCKVIRWDGKVVTELPAEHKPEKVVKKLWELYSLILS